MKEQFDERQPQISNERKRTLAIYQEIKELLPGYREGRIPIGKTCDMKMIWSLTDEIRSEALLHYTSEVELNELIAIANNLVDRVNLANYDHEKGFSIVDGILDSVWHQRQSRELSERNRRNLAKLAINILNAKNEKYWVENLSPSASSYNHCIYFILMLEDRFNTTNEEFEMVFQHLERYIDKYGKEHHLSQRWLKRYEERKNAM